MSLELVMVVLATAALVGVTLCIVGILFAPDAPLALIGVSAMAFSAIVALAIALGYAWAVALAGATA